MLIKLVSIQIPDYWEIIKFSAIKAESVKQENLQSYLNEMFHALLSDKAQCWFRLDDDRKINACFVTRILENRILNQKYLQIQTVYGFSYGDENTWRKDIDTMKEFGKKAGCSYIGFVSDNKRIWQLGNILGFREVHRTYSMPLEA